jgi:hypothetical protein
MLEIIRFTHFLHTRHNICTSSSLTKNQEGKEQKMSKQVYDRVRIWKGKDYSQFHMLVSNIKKIDGVLTGKVQWSERKCITVKLHESNDYSNHRWEGRLN